MNIDTILRHDFKNICYHEAAHLAALKYFGGDGFIRINPEPDTSDPINQSCFNGSVIVAEDAATPWHRRIVGLAGAIGEMMLHDPEMTADDFIDAHAVGDSGLSPTDAEKAGEFTEIDVETTIRVLRDRWDTVEHYAHCELSKGFEGAEHGE
ncbi:hypothetical protein [Salicola sp. Rm-C-2C1-2]|uniref:hypothetical protein n=1 Tax=Salicola sp. Rm-C-2C1-2 TaxID=3141321 RepID=UPI0032E40621